MATVLENMNENEMIWNLNKHKGKANQVFFFFKRKQTTGRENFRNKLSDNSLFIQRLGLDALTARGPGFNN